MAKLIKKTVRIPEEISMFASILAKSLDVSENDVYKMMLFEYIRNTKNDMFYIKRG